jgi:nucleoside-diphosphate-sugar epimerase
MESRTEKPGNENQQNPTAEKSIVLITGAAGLIGSRLAEKLSERYRVIGLDVKEPATGGSMKFVRCDLTDGDDVNRVMRRISEETGGSLLSVIHLAAYYDFAGEPSDLYENLTVKGTARLLQALNKYFRTEQFVFSSTLLVMKPTEEEDEKLTEESTVRPEWDYPKSKVAAEKVILREKGPIPAVILRIAGIYDEGGHSPPICQQISRIYERRMESHFYPGDVDHGQPFLHLEDLVEMIGKVIDKRMELDDYEVFLVAEPDLMSYGELQKNLGRLIHGKNWLTLRVPEVVAKAGAWAKNKFSSRKQFIKPWMIDLADDHYPVDIEKLQKKLSWSPRRRLRHTLPDMVEAIRRNPEVWYNENGIEPPKKTTRKAVRQAG